MRLSDITEFVNGIADPAFACDGFGIIVAWNEAAAEWFGRSSAEALGERCSEVIQGRNERGFVCSSDCVIKQRAAKKRLVEDFDLLVKTPVGEKWFCVGTSVVHLRNSTRLHTIHTLRPHDAEKRLEMAVRDLVAPWAGYTSEQYGTPAYFSRSAFRETCLTRRELEVLSMVADGRTSAAIAEQLHISRATVDNHFQSVLKKLNAHSRLEAVRKAEHAGLIQPS